VTPVSIFKEINKYFTLPLFDLLEFRKWERRL
jgi:hypothetical protein